MRIRLPSALVAMAAAVVMVPASAEGSPQLLRINGATRVAAGQSTKLVISGRARRRRGLAIYLDGARCARGVAAEEERGISRQLVVRAVHGSFKHILTFLRSSAGSHYICAYLYHGGRGRFVTDQRASFHYITR